MFGDVFGTRTDYSKGILYSSRNMYLADEYITDLGEGWQDGDKIRAPSNMMSKKQLKRDRLRRKFIENGVIEIKHIKALEDIQAHSDRSAQIRETMKLRTELHEARHRPQKKIKDTTNDTTTESNSSTTSTSTKASMNGLIQRQMQDSKAKADAFRSGGGSKSNYQEEYAKKVAAAWEYITDEGHPYWYNELSGKMQFENPFKTEEEILEEIERDENKGKEPIDNFSFLDEWKYASKYSEEIKKPEKKRKQRTKTTTSSTEEGKV